MKIEIEHTITSDGKIMIGFDPSVDIPDGLCIEHGEPVQMVDKMAHQPMIRHDIYKGVSVYELPPKEMMDPLTIKEVYIEAPDEE